MRIEGEKPPVPDYADANQRWTVGDPVYPPYAAAPDWHWIKVFREDGVNWDWVEVNRPDPIFYTLHPNTDDTANMKREEDYPPQLHRAVRAYNAPHKAEFRNRVSRAVMRPLLLLETLNQSLEAGRDLDLYDLSHGYTKTVNLGDRGFVKHEDGGTTWQQT